MKHSILKKSLFVIAALFIFSAVNMTAQNRVYSLGSVENYKMEVLKEKLDLSADQINKAKSIEQECNKKLEDAANNTAAQKVYKWRDAEYKKILNASQYRTYMKERDDIIAEAQFRWMQENGTEVVL